MRKLEAAQVGRGGSRRSHRPLRRAAGRAAPDSHRDSRRRGCAAARRERPRGPMPPRSSAPTTRRSTSSSAATTPAPSTAFGSFLRTYPRAPLASSAQYWIGNAHFARRDYRAALTAQRTLIANYPDSSKVPDALLNIASAQSELGDAAGARRTLEELVAKHPQSEAAARRGSDSRGDRPMQGVATGA